MLTMRRKGISSSQLAKDLGIGVKAAWYMLQRLRHVAKGTTSKRFLENVVEVDETYVGGSETNKHLNKRVRGSGNYRQSRVPVFGILEKHGELRMKRIDGANYDSVFPMIISNISPSALICTDESRIYKWLPKENHISVNHSAGQYGNGGFTTNRIEGVFSHFKRNITGIYHWCSEKHIQKYLDMFCFRWNTRERTMAERLDLFFGLVGGRRLPWIELVRGY